MSQSMNHLVELVGGLPCPFATRPTSAAHFLLQGKHLVDFKLYFTGLLTVLTYGVRTCDGATLTCGLA